MPTYYGSTARSVYELLSANARSTLFNKSGTLIYVARGDGVIDVFDAASHSLITSWTVGTSLTAMSLSEDGSFLLAIEQTGPNSGRLHRVSTIDGSTQSITTAHFTDVEIVDAQTAILTGSSHMKFDLVSGEFTPLQGSNGWAAITEDQHLSLIGSANSSNGPLAVYDDRVGGIVATGDNYQQGAVSGFNNGHQAISEAAGLIAQFIYYGNINIYDLSVKFVRTINVGGTVDGLAFDQQGNFFYAYLIETGALVKYSTEDWTEVERFPVAQSTWHNFIGSGDQIHISADGTYITVANNNGGRLQLIDLSARNETFAGTAGADTFIGRDGNDTYLVGSGDVVVEERGEGIDTVETQLASYSLGSHVENLIFTGSSGFTATGNNLDNLITAGDGDDTIVVTPGNDTADGGAGTDTLIVYMRDQGLIPTLPAGYSFTVTAANLRDESGTINTTFAGVERIVFSTAVVSGGGTRGFGVVYIDGSASTIPITFTTLGSFSDTLIGGSADDLFNLNRSQGTVEGGAGNDTVSLIAEPNFTYTLTDALGGGVYVRTQDGRFGYTATLTGIETIIVPGTQTNASASDFDGYVFLDSSSGESVSGSRGDDRFRNGPGAGQGGGTDSYRGNGGADVFDFSGALARIGTKTIGDFDGNDRIDLSGGGVFIGTAAFSGVAGQIRYETANGQTIVRIDANGDGTADQTITLGSGAYALTETAAGSAVLRIATPQNVVDGGNGDDDLIGTSGDDLVRGVNGNDTIRATAGTDYADGGDGTDRLLIGVGGSGEFAGTATPQTYVFNGTGATNAAIGLATSTGLIETIVLDTTAAGGVGDTIDASAGTVALSLMLGGGGDTVTGSSQNDIIDAGAGADSVNGGAGSDRIYGGEGNDTLRGGLGSDLLDGGAGDDVIYGNSSTSDYFAPSADNAGNYLYGGSGADTLYGSGFLFSAGRLSDNSGEDDIGAEKDVLVGSGTFSVGAGDDATGTNTTTDILRLTLTGAASGVDINMAAFNSTLWTVAGGSYRNFDQISTITGSNFADTFTVGNNVTTIIYLNGGDGDDTLILGTGENGGGRILFQAGAGNDTVVYGSNSQNFVNGGEGVDTLDLRLAISAPFSYAGFEIILGSGAADSFNGGAENNELYGFGGNDTLSGGDGNDILEGGDGDDIVYAGGGDDLIVGGAGADQMSGGSGVDSFVYRLVTDSTTAASDRLTDFQSGVDRIDLTAFRVGVVTLVNSGALATATIETDQGTMRITSDYAFALSDFVLGERAFTGTAGADSFAGGGMNDSFDMSQGGDDSVSGGGGNDAFFFGAALTAADSVDGGAGTNDQLGLQGDYTGANALTLGANTISGIELIGLLGGAGNGYAITTVDANVAAGQVLTIFGTNLAAGNNFTFNGAAETDGSFRIYGGAGTDNFTGGAQNDGFWFGPGRFDPSVDRVNGGGGNNDQLALDGDYTMTLDGTAIQGIETITLQAGPASDRNSFDITVADSFVGAGQQVTIFGLLAVNAIRIDASTELDGSVRVFGGQGSDSIYGSAGDDRLFGGAGADFLYGGGGNDIYVYDAVSQSTGVNADGIHLTGGDKIDFNFAVGGVAATVASGTLSLASFDADIEAAIGGGQMGTGQAVLFRPDAGTHAGTSFLIVDANGVAGYQAGEDYVIQLAGNPTDLPPDPFV
ncbi:beta strand repeat-containing protein [Sphingomonas sp. LT1P40]|uniref:beta strand repeat-containing protein n=1 Tax=Alteristakelama amylovorans TaxID=3096166 RepID=UPI002FC6279D